MHFDVTKPDETQDVLKYIEAKYGKLNVLALNAGIPGYIGKQHEQSEEDFDRIVGINLKSVFLFIKDAYPLLKRTQDDANILVTSSAVGTYPIDSFGVYSMTKASLNNMVKWMAEDLRADNIRINAVAPGVVVSKITQPLIDSGNIPSGSQKFKSEPEKIASVAAMIFSHDGSFVNGEIFNVHGGFTRI